MPLESATYISQLEVTNPASTDLLGQADDHLRLIKSVLKSTFPNVTGAVTATQAELNSPFTMPVGFIGVWYGSSGSVPSGWAICDGSTVNLTSGSGTIVTPDLRDRTVVGAGTIAAQGTTAGATTASGTTSSQGAHSHTGSITGGAHSHSPSASGTSLTIAQMPAHNHGAGISAVGNQTYVYGSKSGTASANMNFQTGVGGSLQPLTETVGNGDPHTHTITEGGDGSHTHSLTTSSDGAHTHTVSVSTVQPSMGLHWIMKV